MISYPAYPFKRREMGLVASKKTEEQLDTVCINKLVASEIANDPGRNLGQTDSAPSIMMVVATMHETTTYDRLQLQLQSVCRALVWCCISFGDETPVCGCRINIDSSQQRGCGASM